MGVLLIIGGSKGIGSALLALEVENRAVINISRTAPKIEHPNLTHYSLDVLNDELPTIKHWTESFIAQEALTYSQLVL